MFPETVIQKENLRLTLVSSEITHYEKNLNSVFQEFFSSITKF